jgi:hypothetical protein
MKKQDSGKHRMGYINRTVNKYRRTSPPLPDRLSMKRQLQIIGQKTIKRGVLRGSFLTNELQ